jgi:hypothetical protein
MQWFCASLVWCRLRVVVALHKMTPFLMAID